MSLAASESIEASAVQRRLSHAVDPFALYAALSDKGRRPDTALFERTGGATLLMDRAAVRAECRGESVVLSALTSNGETLLKLVASRPAGEVIADEPDRLVLRFPRSDGFDAEGRLLAPSPLHAIRQLISPATASGEEPFAGAAIGIVAFDYATLCEDVPDNAEDPLGFPDFIFWVPDSLVLFEPGSPARLICTAFACGDFAEDRRNHNDAAERLAKLVEACASAPALMPLSNALLRELPPFETDLDDNAYAEVVRRLREEIARGEIYQIVPSRTFRAPCSDPLRAYAALRELETSPYRFYVSGADLVLFGASPETSVRLYREEGWPTVEVRPIAGTRPRGATADEDDRLEAEMRLDEKEIAEHMMLVDLARNDVARISIPGTRRVARLLTVERYARVMHLVSSVTGKLAIGFDALDALAACLNVGTLTGAPKIRATHLLRQTERTKRGPYGGAIGWVNGAGMMDTAVVIRSAVVRDGTAFVRAGAGVVYDSDPQAEADETRRKASALLSILAATEANA
jgi:anthranilate synthase component 1